jgi:F0F1-type ATP synthase delta subunit
MYIKDYINATYAVLDKNDSIKDTLSSLQSYLKKRGLQKMYPMILRGLSEKVRSKGRTAMVTVYVARPEDLKVYKDEIDVALKTLSKTTEYVTSIDTSLIGGFIIRGNGKSLDRSYKQSLLHTYQRVTETV